MISTLMTENSKKAILVSAKMLERVMCIQYLIAFLGAVIQNGSALNHMSILFDSDSKVNAIHPAFAEKLGFVVQTTNIGGQKMDSTTLETYRMMVAVFSVINQANRVKFFEEIFLVANVSPDVIFGMHFLTLSGVDVNFSKRDL